MLILAVIARNTSLGRMYWKEREREIERGRVREREREIEGKKG